MVTFWERAVHSVDHMFSLYFAYFVILVISRFGFEDGVWFRNASFAGHCILVTFTMKII